MMVAIIDDLLLSSATALITHLFAKNKNVAGKIHVNQISYVFMVVMKRHLTSIEDDDNEVVIITEGKIKTNLFIILSI